MALRSNNQGIMNHKTKALKHLTSHNHKEEVPVALNPERQKP